MLDTTTLPPSITEYNQWVTYGNGRREKAPTQPVSDDRHASTSNPETWGTLDEALAHVESDNRGLGFVLTEKDPYLMFDVDCPDYSDGSLPDWLPSLEGFGCPVWVYRTPSGAGFRIVLKLDSPDAIPQSWTNLSDEYDGQTREVAMFYSGKYMTVTGDLLPGYRIPSVVDPADLHLWLQEARASFPAADVTVDTSSDSPTHSGQSDASGAARTGTQFPGVYDVISEVENRPGERTEHPFHGSDTGANFRVDTDNGNETWRCWRHGVTGHAGHLLGMDVGVLSCADVGSVATEEWAAVYEAARFYGYDIPE